MLLAESGLWTILTSCSPTCISVCPFHRFGSCGGVSGFPWDHFSPDGMQHVSKDTLVLEVALQFSCLPSDLYIRFSLQEILFII